MRIIAGSRRGRKLLTLKGNQTRPTADRVKEALFSILAPYLPGARVLDAFAGSGALGLEALSRGAQSAWFCEHSRAAAEICAKNIAGCAFEQAHLLQGDTELLLPLLRRQQPQLQFDLVFLDPPYRSDLLRRIIILLKEQELLAAEGLIAAESDAASPPVDLPFCRLQKEKKYGGTLIRCYCFTEDSE